MIFQSQKVNKNKNNKETKVGRFMFGIGALIVNKKTKKILITKRGQNTNFNQDLWEIMYGRVDQHESPIQGLKREIYEETGIVKHKIEGVLRFWHFYRGVKKSAKNELYGLTFLCSVHSDQIKLSREHTDYRWASAQEAKKLIELPGVLIDIDLCQQYFEQKLQIKKMPFTDLDNKTVYY